MKLFVGLWALFTVVQCSAGFLKLGLLGGGGVGGLLGQGSGHNHGYIKGPQHSHGHGSSAQVFKVKVINEGRGASYGPGPGPGYVRGQASAPQVIRLIHHQAGSVAAASSPGPVSAPAQVIKVFHEHGARNFGSLSTSGSAIQQQISAPAKVIRIIHELAPAQSAVPAASFPSVAATAPGYNYLPPVQAPPQNFNAPVQQYSAPSYQSNVASAQYLPPQPQYSAPPSSFTAPEPVPAHIPAQSYGPPSQ